MRDIKMLGGVFSVRQATVSAFGDHIIETKRMSQGSQDIILALL